MTPTNIKGQLQQLANELGGGELFVADENRQYRPTEHGRAVLERARRVLAEVDALARLSSPVCRIAFLPQHAHIVASARRYLRDASSDVTLELHVLEEHHRSRAGFEANVVTPLQHGAFDIVVGLPPRGHKQTLRQQFLYSSRLEARVPVNRAGDHIELTELVEKHSLLVPPAHTRSRVLLDGEIRQHVDPELIDRRYTVHLEAYGTKVLVTFADIGEGTVVVPSDISYPFKNGSSFGGAGSADCAWVPVTQDDEPLTHDVVVTTQKSSHRSDTVSQVVAALGETAASMALGATARGHACEVTELLRQTDAVPIKRSRPS
ncbi:DNA-binding transcriptional LysR family regulator [Saccharothrix texasensis]|uniref:DNA-binding transcriptional LysR family regulator n=2 Tax=Saccharothrix texasensis TaxID=103734 RepID=A0A3N1HEK6_9PSEU|nr:DNA-binding transcriptional LysR family regulator [Saccharothrix texasensis]